MTGFFDDDALCAMTPVGCGHTCKLHTNCKAPTSYRGQGARRILLLGEAPSVGYWETLPIPRSELDRDYWRAFTVRCPTPDGREPTYAEAVACRPDVLRLVAELQPKLIILFGATAVRSVIGHSNEAIALRSGTGGGGFGLLRGELFPDRKFPGIWFGVTLSPKIVAAQSFDKVVGTVFRQDIEHFTSAPLPESRESDEADRAACRLLSTPADIAPMLRRILVEKPTIAFDYETTGLKPHAHGHRVVSIGLAPSNKRAFAFRLPADLTQDGWRDVCLLWRTLMADREVRKVAHNVPFEWSWTRQCFHVIPVGWIGDTQVLSHLEDSRAGHSGLKMQAYLKFGVGDYATAADAYKKAPKDSVDAVGANAKNDMERAPDDVILPYNALDALYCRRLFYWFVEKGGVTLTHEGFRCYG